MTKTISQTIDAQTLYEWLSSESINLIDVRETIEFASEKITGAAPYPLSSFDPSQLPLNADQKTVLYCQSGRRSQQALDQCLAMGLNNVASLEGGLTAWKNAGYPTKVNKNAPISLFRQVQIVAGTLVFTGTVLGAFVAPGFLVLSGFVGAGLVFAGVTNTCAMGMLLAKLPYNQRAGQRM